MNPPSNLFKTLEIISLGKIKIMTMCLKKIVLAHVYLVFSLILIFPPSFSVSQFGGQEIKERLQQLNDVWEELQEMSASRGRKLGNILISRIF